MRITKTTMQFTAMLLLAKGLVFVPGKAQAAETCSAGDFAAVMDQTGANLNAQSAANSKRIRKKSVLLTAKLKTKTTNVDGLHLTAPARARVSRHNTHIDELMSRMDRLGDLTLDPTTDCRRLTDLKATSTTLLRVLNQRFALIDKDLEAQIKLSNQSSRNVLASKRASPVQQSTKVPTAKWTTTTKGTQRNLPPTFGQQTVTLPPITPVLPAPGTVSETFTIAEINTAGRGFFGTISTSLANVINYTFQKVGRPNGYILGREGGGAFIAGLRYGSGRLVMKHFARQKVYWRGPSIGYDAGAEGARTMFLIYNLRDPKKLFRRFSGADGAAYLVGGVGITFLTNGKVVLAPIRSGIGLRLGASVGYLKFSSKPGWNPF